MPEIKPDLSDRNRCISVHWTLPVQCVLPSSHRENWHEAWHPETGNRIRYRRSMGIFRTEELNGDWTVLEIPPPGEICGEPHGYKPGVFCQEPRVHLETSWTHRAVVDGCRYTWNTLIRDPAPIQVAEDLSRVREIAAALYEENARLRAGEADSPGDLDDWPTPAEWIRRWNDATPEQRLRIAQAQIDLARAAAARHALH